MCGKVYPTQAEHNFVLEVIESRYNAARTQRAVK